LLGFPPLSTLCAKTVTPVAASYGFVLRHRGSLVPDPPRGMIPVPPRLVSPHLFSGTIDSTCFWHAPIAGLVSRDKNWRSLPPPSFPGGHGKVSLIVISVSLHVHFPFSPSRDNCLVTEDLCCGGPPKIAFTSSLGNQLLMNPTRRPYFCVWIPTPPLFFLI